ncbi:Mitochondrial import inner membrane translocase subunit tim23 [Chytridiales sp. JEL 0842]|nr:Mitochondrial import inner membrane translocase subunit tim23 [Chytridiales sp. JEL 0842]
MSFFNFGGSSAQSTSTSSTPSSTSSEFLPDSPEPQAPQSFQSDASFSSTDSSSTPTTVSSLVSAATSPRVTLQLHPVPAEDQEIEYLFINSHPLGPKDVPVGSFGPIPMRTGTDKLCYGTGAAYMLGLTYGALYGTYRGLQIAQGNSFKIRMNSVINSGTRYGPWAANSLGILTMGWSLLDNAFSSYRGVSDYYNHFSAAFLTGAIFKSTAGIRPALVAGTLMSSVVGAYALYEGGLQEKFGLPELTKKQLASA